MILSRSLHVFRSFPRAFALDWFIRVSCRRSPAWLVFLLAIVFGADPLQGQDFTKQWSYTLGGYASSSPALSADGETIYIGVENRDFGRVLAIPKSGGLPRWSRTLSASVISSPAVGADGTVYVGCENGKFYALSPSDGATKWEINTRTWVTSSPAIGADGTVYFGAGNSLLYAIAADGRQRWTYSAGAAIDSSPSVGGDGTIYFGCNDGHVYAVAPDGALKWDFKTGGVVDTSPAIAADGTVYVTSHDQKLYAFTPAGVKKWERMTNDKILASPALGADGTIYFASCDRNFYAVRPEDGSIRWQTDYGGTSKSTAAVRADGVIIFGADDGILRGLDPESGKIHLTYDTKGVIGDFIESSPLIAPDGSIYFGSLDGYLYKLNGNGSPLSTYSSWPAFRRDLKHTGRSVNATGEGQLANISTRARAGAGNTLIAGFFVQGTPASFKTYLVRAIGPGLAQSGINGFIQDPQLNLFSGEHLLQSNDNWPEKDRQSLFPVAETANAVGAFPLDFGSKDAAIVRPLPPGIFTAQVGSADESSGVSLIEVYDVRGSGDPATRLLNLSTRGQVRTGQDILIAGFVVRDGPLRLLLRGVGPGLAQFGVGGVLQRPRLELFRDSTSLASNTGWTTGGYKGDLAGAGARVAAFSFQENSNDSAMLFSAEPGPYTLQISGVGATTGEALVEIYVLP